MTSGAPPWAFAVAVAIVVIVCTVNVLTALHDRPSLPLWAASTWEYSSGVVTVLLLPLAARAVALAGAPATRGWGRFLGVHACAAALYAVVHVAGFVALRKGVYLALGHSPYRFGGLGEWLYEFRKDAVSYGAVAGLFAFARLRVEKAAATSTGVSPAAASRYEIRDGTRVIRPEVAEIAAATSAGNYVEFHLADGRRPLMRTTLAAVEAELGVHGFLRTHRSWLVNAARVREIAPSGSGDMRLVLDTGLEAPLSRRYPQALVALKR